MVKTGHCGINPQGKKTLLVSIAFSLLLTLIVNCQLYVVLSTGAPSHSRRLTLTGLTERKKIDKARFKEKQLEATTPFKTENRFNEKKSLKNIK